MHEFSLVQNIIEIAEKGAGEKNTNPILAVEVEVGKASGVDEQALLFAWNAATRGTRLEGALMQIVTRQISVRCYQCHLIFEPEELLDPCPSCKTPGGELLAGRELKVVAIEM
jgi:hydrogenase nickel incorporation protein HypA/HybF